MVDYSVQRRSALCLRADFVRECVDVPKFLGFCRECPNFGKIWMCPPFSLDPMRLWEMYEKIKLVGAKISFDMAGAPDMDEAALAVKTEKAKLMEELWAEEKRVKGSLSFFAGSCPLCERCSRIDGLPCIHPDKARYSIEAIGADVGKAASKYLGWELTWGSKGKPAEYYILIAALFMK